MKKNILLFFLVICKVSFAQNEISTTVGIIHFEASVPLFEEVFASNEMATCLLDTKTGVINSTVLMKEFRFKLALMEQHFNDKYIESDRYSKATFKGRIKGFNLFIIGNTPKEFEMNGELKIHGKSKKIKTIVFLKKGINGLEINADFKVKTKDFDIKIPEILSVKVAETVNIKSNFLLQ